MASTVSGYIGQINPGDGTNYAIGSTAYGVCTTSASTVAKTVDMTGFTLIEGATIHVKFKNGNTASSPTLNVNGTGAKPIAIAAGQDQFGLYHTSIPFKLKSDELASFTYYDGAWVINTGYDSFNNVGSYVECSTGASTAAKTVSLTGFDLKTGTTVHIKFAYTNTATNPTLNVNSTGAKALYLYGTTRVGTSEATSWKAGQVVSFTYNGTSWYMNGSSGLPAGGYIGQILAKVNNSDGAVYWAYPSNIVPVHKTLIFSLFDVDYNGNYSDNPTGPFHLEWMQICGPTYASSGGIGLTHIGELFQGNTPTGYAMDNIFLDYGTISGDFTDHTDNNNICERYKCTWISLGEEVQVEDDDYASWMAVPYQDDDQVYRLQMRFETRSVLNGKSVLKTIYFKTFYSSYGYEFDDIYLTDESYPYRVITYTANAGLTAIKQVNSSPITSLPETILDSWITADTVVLRMELYDPSAQADKWTVTTSDGAVTISGTLTSGGSTTAKLTLAKGI